LGVASFLVNYFWRDPFPGTCGCAPFPGCTLKVPLPTAERSEGAEAELAVYLTILPASSLPLILSPSCSNPAKSQRFRVSEHGAAIECCTTYFDQNFAKRRVRDQANSLRSLVQRARRPENRLKRQPFQMPTPRTNRVGRRSCITSPMQKALRDILIKQPYLYRCEMANFLYRRFRKRISDRSIGRTLR
jgi:hypothetical protein